MPKCLVTAVLLAAVAFRAPAQWYLGGSTAYYHWSEAIQPIAVVEAGLLLGFDAGYTQPVASGLLFAYRGKLYGGAAQYSGAGLFNGNPATSVTGYFGTMQEIQGRYRFTDRVDIVCALGGEFWRRELNTKQEENYSVVYLALGAEYNAMGPGVTAGLRLNRPVWAQLDANLNALGFEQDPVITPGNAIGGSATLGYRFERKWALIAYADLFRFPESPVVHVSGPKYGVTELFQPATKTYVLGVRVEFSR